MKHIIVIFITCISFSTYPWAKKNSLEKITAIRSEENGAEKPLSKIPLRRIIAAYIMNIVHHCTQIALNPHSRPNLGNNITALLGNIITIALIASDKNNDFSIPPHEQSMLDHETYTNPSNNVTQEAKL